MSKKSVKVVLSGSGVLYPFHAGALRRIVEDYEIEEITGVSGGSIVAAFVASGYEPGRELESCILNTLPSERNLIDFNWLPLFKWGLIKGNKALEEFERWFVDTFEEVEVPLNIGTVNLNEGRYHTFNKEKTPGFLVARAVRASMSFPLAFEPIKIDDDYYVDGGVMAHYPIDRHGQGEDVIGVKIEPKPAFDYKQIDDIWDYMASILRSMMTSIAQEKREDAPLAKTIKIKGKEKTLDLNISRTDAQRMIERGYEVADNQL